MRLWHQALIPYLPRQQLLGQHRECCALRGKGWGRKHKTVNYVFKHDFSKLFDYHGCIINEMHFRGYHVNGKWSIVSINNNSELQVYRGTQIGFDSSLIAHNLISNLFTSFSYLRATKTLPNILHLSNLIYPEHNNEYLCECIENLKRKNVVLNGITFEELDRKLNTQRCCKDLSK